MAFTTVYVPESETIVAGIVGDLTREPSRAFIKIGIGGELSIFVPGYGPASAAGNRRYPRVRAALPVTL